ncbi:holo-ACP synthase [Solimonas flava]|uniref:holo-ACP synthase n=1 Tax=Solimonas flava TaxID=415849 RepID=UPI00042A4AD4|nr:holo-ACP synthase [Solimonas flava]
MTAAPPSAPGVYGIGVDVLRVERMQKLLDKHGSKLLLRLLAPRELREVRARSNRARALAMCWAAKEAFVKALGTGFDGIGWREVGVIREANGRPALIYDRKMRARLKALGVGAAHVSLSDDGGLVCAYVVLERA